MQKAIRRQYDGQQEHYSELSGTTFTGKGATRQEFKDEADINKLLARYGVGAGTRPTTFGTEVDYTIDLQQALNAITDAKHAFRNLPQNLRARYKTWQDLLNALNSGRLTMHNAEPPADPPTPEEKPK